MINTADTRQRHAQRFSGNLCKHRLHTLADRGDTGIDLDHAVRRQHQTRVFAWAGGTAFDVTADAEPMITARDQTQECRFPDF